MNTYYALLLVFSLSFLSACGGGGRNSDANVASDPNPIDDNSSDTDNNPPAPKANNWELSHVVTNTDGNGDTGYFERNHWDMDVSDDGRVQVAWEFVVNSVVGTPRDINTVSYYPENGWGKTETILPNIGRTVFGNKMRVSINDAQSKTLLLGKPGSTDAYAYEEDPSTTIWSEAGKYRVSNNNPRIEESVDGALLMSSPALYENRIRYMQSYYSPGPVSEASLEKLYPITYNISFDADHDLLRDNIHMDNGGVVHVFYPAQREPIPYSPRPSDDPVLQYSQGVQYQKRFTDGSWSEPITIGVTDLAVNTKDILLGYDAAKSPNDNHAVVTWIEKRVTEKVASLKYRVMASVLRDDQWGESQEVYTSDTMYAYGNTVVKSGIDAHGNALIALLPKSHSSGVNTSLTLLVSAYSHDTGWSNFIDVGSSYSDDLTQTSMSVLSSSESGQITIITKELVGHPSRATQGTQQNSVADYLISRSFDPSDKRIIKKEIIRLNYKTNGYAKHKGISDQFKADMDANGNMYVLWAYDRNPTQYVNHPILELSISRLNAL